MPKNEPTKKRLVFQSVFFMINECIDAIDALEKIHCLYKEMMTASWQEREKSIFDQRTVISLVGITRDCFCIRLAYLFDKRKDVHSLKKYFKGEEINKLEQHPVAIAAVKARHGNIAHMGKEYVRWPDVDDILSSDLRRLLKNIRDRLLFVSRGVKPDGITE